ncbi:MAG: hypothetical protein Q7W45_15160 [Bacteroidota bacterium]|nr:hypothetical protein [Bacteroidota bacterium]MDP3147294.1 hypothetical protein [Bacteroidota bacterium]MDP3557332.1 hypothetical protein [Bacteroidota bacterium]
MKKAILLSSIMIIATQFSSMAQTNKKKSAPSDAATGYTYNFDKANELIFERLLNPNSSNMDVKSIVEEKSFPKLSNGEKIDSEYKKKVALWIEKNPNLIISNFKNRKDVVQSY